MRKLIIIHETFRSRGSLSSKTLIINILILHFGDGRSHHSFILQRFSPMMTDKQKFKLFRDFIFWQQEGLDIDESPSLIINFGDKFQFENTFQIRGVIMIF